MTKEELEKEAEKKYCNGCKWRIEQCLWAWRNTNGLNEPNEKNCSCKEVPAYLAGAEPREKQIAELTEQNTSLLTSVENLNKSVQELEAQIEKMKCCTNCKHSRTEYEHCRTNKHEKWEIKND